MPLGSQELTGEPENKRVGGREKKKKKNERGREEMSLGEWHKPFVGTAKEFS